jgi:hypothetical protein
MGSEARAGFSRRYWAKHVDRNVNLFTILDWSHLEKQRI